MNVKAYRTMTESVQDLKQRGFTANFELLGGRFRAVETGKTFEPSDLTIVAHYRFEGMSDPDDLSILYAIETNDGTRGLIADAYGPYANADLAAFLRTVPLHEEI